MEPECVPFEMKVNASPRFLLILIAELICIGLQSHSMNQYLKHGFF